MLKRSSSDMLVFTIYFVAFFASFGNSLIIPLVPSIMEAFQVGAVEVTLLISIYALPGMFLIPVLGFLQDFLGRKTILLGSILLCLVVSLGMSMTENFGMLVFLRALQGLSVTPLEALSNTLVADNFTGAERVKHVGTNISVLYVGVAVFPLLSAGMLFLGGWRSAMWLPLMFGVPLFFFALRMPMKYEAKDFSMQSYWRNLRGALLSHKLQLLLCIRLLSALILFGCIHSYLSLLVTEKLGGSAEFAGILFSIMSVGMAFGCVLLGVLLRHFSLRCLGLCGSLMLAFGIFCMLVSPSPDYLVVPMFVLGFGFGQVVGLTTSLVANCSQDNTRGSIMSFYSAFFRASQTVAPLFFGFLYHFGSFTVLYGGALVLSLVLVVVVGITYKICMQNA